MSNESTNTLERILSNEIFSLDIFEYEIVGSRDVIEGGWDHLYGRAEPLNPKALYDPGEECFHLQFGNPTT